LTDAVLTRLRRESRDARKNRYSAYAIVLSTKRVIFCIVFMNFFLIIVVLGRIRMERAVNKPSRCDSRRRNLHLLIGTNTVRSPIQESGGGKFLAPVKR
jgi:hypothetical protein